MSVCAMCACERLAEREKEESRIQQCDFDQLQEGREQLKRKRSQHNTEREAGEETRVKPSCNDVVSHRITKQKKWKKRTCVPRFPHTSWGWQRPLYLCMGTGAAKLCFANENAFQDWLKWGRCSCAGVWAHVQRYLCVHMEKGSDLPPLCKCCYE